MSLALSFNTVNLLRKELQLEPDGANLFTATGAIEPRYAPAPTNWAMGDVNWLTAHRKSCYDTMGIAGYRKNINKPDT